MNFYEQSFGQGGVAWQERHAGNIGNVAKKTTVLPFQTEDLLVGQ